MRHRLAKHFLVGVERGGVVDSAGIGHGVDEDALVFEVCVLLGEGREDGNHVVGSLLKVGEHGFGDG